ALLVLGVILFAVFRPILVLPRIRLAPGFVFNNQYGEAVTNEDFRGQFTLYSFTYTQCEQDNCPLSAAQISEVHQILNEIVPSDMDFGLVTISIDPEEDTADVLAEHMATLDVAENTAVPWVFASGEALRTKYVVGGGFRVYYDKDSSTGMRFTPRYVLVDPAGIIRAEYGTAVLDFDILHRDIDLLVEEMRNSSGLGRYGYEAAHLFVCYP
ncbi:MAG: SCO family protein, partial [Anaerolineales bacterium]|nr:SCO family protein [Anaerolineales bacterium]